MIWALLIGSALACPDPAQSLLNAEAAVVEARLDDADAALGDFDEALGCAGWQDADVLARAWLAEAVLRTFEGDELAAREAFAAARRASSTTWVSAYGDPLKEVWLSAEDPPERGTLASSVELPSEWTWVDGEAVELPIEVAAGLHAIQIIPLAGKTRYGRMVVVSEGKDLRLLLDDVDLEPPDPFGIAKAKAKADAEAAALVAEHPGLQLGDRVFLVAAGGTAVLAGVSAVVASRQPAVQESAQTLADLERSRAVQVGAGGLTYAALAGIAGLLSVQFMFGRKAAGGAE